MKGTKISKESHIKKHKDKITELNNKYSSCLITQKGSYNIRTVKKIALEAGMVKPYVDINEQGTMSINCEIIDRGGDIEMIYNFCLYLLKTYPD